MIPQLNQYDSEGRRHGYGNTTGQTEHSGGESTITRESFMEFVNITAQTALSRVDTIT